MKKSITGDQWNAQTVPQAPTNQNPFWVKLKRITADVESEVSALRVAITGAVSSREIKNLKRNMARRVFQDGYPKITPFDTMEQITHYLKGSPKGMTCLICGNTYLSLGLHLSAIHSIGVDEYKDAYGLPSSQSLACIETKGKYRECLQDRIDKGSWNLMGTTDQAKLARSCKKKDSETKYKRLSTSTRTRMYTEEDGRKVMDVLRSSTVTVRETFDAHPELMPYMSFVRWKAEDPTRQQEFLAIVEAMDFKVQAKMQRLGVRFTAKVIELRKQEMSIDEISAVLSVHRMVISYHLRKYYPEHTQLKRTKKEK